MTVEEILAVALRQSAVDMSCDADDFRKRENVVTVSRAAEGARAYLKQPFFCEMTTYGTNVVASVREDVRAAVEGYLKGFPADAAVRFPYLRRLEKAVGGVVVNQSVCCLPGPGAQEVLPCPLPTRLLTPDDFGPLYTDEWSNALCEARKSLDVLGVGAYDGDRLVGLAGCSADCADMWQIGIDVLPDYRRRGIASALTSRLAIEILRRGKVPFYCYAGSNLPSMRNAQRSGFRPVWLTVALKEVAAKQ